GGRVLDACERGVGGHGRVELVREAKGTTGGSHGVVDPDRYVARHHRIELDAPPEDDRVSLGVERHLWLVGALSVERQILPCSEAAARGARCRLDDAVA